MGWEKKRFFFEDIGNREGKNWELGRKNRELGKKMGTVKIGNMEGKNLGMGKKK